MLIEQLIFITIAFTLFVYVFYKLIKKNDTSYVPILAIQAIGIAIDFAQLYFVKEDISVFVKTIIFVLSILMPILMLAIEKINGNFVEMIYIFFARLNLLFGNLKGAKAQLIKLVTKNPESYLGHKFLAQIYEKEGGQRKAVDEYTQAIQVNKKDYDSYYKVANLLSDLDKKEEAAEMLINLLSKKPDYINATIALGDILIDKEDYKEAVNIYTEALKYNPTNYDLNYNLGISYTMLNDFKNARLYYERAAELNSMVYNTKYSLAEIAVIYKELEEAEKYFLQAAQDEELCADAYLELSKIYILKNDKDQAIKYANVAIQENPKKIVEKIKNDVTFAIIIAKLSIPFNLEYEDDKIPSLTKKEIRAKEHLEQMVEITKKIGYNNIKIPKKEVKEIKVEKKYKQDRYRED